MTGSYDGILTSKIPSLGGLRATLNCNYPCTCKLGTLRPDGFALTNGNRYGVMISTVQNAALTRIVSCFILAIQPHNSINDLTGH